MKLSFASTFAYGVVLVVSTACSATSVTEGTQGATAGSPKTGGVGNGSAGSAGAVPQGDDAGRSGTVATVAGSGNSIGVAGGGVGTELATGGDLGVGGATTGGLTNTGGQSIGGAATGGAATGGAATGGAATGGAATGGKPPTCTNVTLAEGTGVRRISSQTLVLTFGAVKAGTEDRMILEWNLNGLTLPITQAQMSLPLQNIDPGDPSGIMDVYTYVGDGQVTPEDFDAGTSRYTYFTANDNKTYEVDLSTPVRTALANNTRYLGIRLSTTTTDRYDVNTPYELNLCKP